MLHYPIVSTIKHLRIYIRIPMFYNYETILMIQTIVNINN